MAILSDDHVSQFQRDGYVVVRQAVTGASLEAAQRQLADWVEESRSQTANWGTCMDGKARFDVAEGHSAECPLLRRISNPTEISDVIKGILFDSAIPDAITDLIGPNVKFHHCKINVKLPGSPTYVGWHQDHAFDPHTNDDVVVALLLLDDVTEDMGPLMVVPGSHKTPLSLFNDGRYTGTIGEEHHAGFEQSAVPLTGKAGDVVLQHTWMVHGGGPNTTDRPRALLICDYTAADAFALTPPAMPSAQYGQIVRGEATRFARLTDTVIELPEAYEDDSFFGLQGQKAAAE
ncbi:MAG: phytanoyl-CoA dioxygenase family protein [Pseudomonadota bacterium]